MEEAEDTLIPTKVSDNKKNYAKVIAKVDSSFQVKNNIIFERARFNRRC